MTVALATSTPTSTTVVAIETSISWRTNRSMIASFSRLGSRPWSSATRTPASGPVRTASNSATALVSARLRLPLFAVDCRRDDVCLPAQFDVAPHELVGRAALRSSRRTKVSTGVRPGGSSSRIDRSRSA